MAKNNCPTVRNRKRTLFHYCNPSLRGGDVDDDGNMVLLDLVSYGFWLVETKSIDDSWAAAATEKGTDINDGDKVGHDLDIFLG